METPQARKKQERFLKKKEIDKNIQSIQNVFRIFLKSKNSKTKPIFVNNYSWLSKLNYISFLREIGKYFTVRYSEAVFEYDFVGYLSLPTTLNFILDFSLYSGLNVFI